MAMSFHDRLNVALEGISPRNRDRPERPYRRRPEPAKQPIPDDRKSKYSFRYRFDNTVEAMAKVEGEAVGDPQAGDRWLEQQLSGGPGTVMAARQKLLEMLKLSTGNALDRHDGMTKVAVIDGLNGNLWNVYLNGLVTFDSKYAQNGGAMQAAERAGFDLER